MTQTTEISKDEIGKLGERIVNLLCSLDNKHTFVSDDFDEILEAVKILEDKAREKESEFERLNKLINTPHTDDFMKAVPLEAAHQIERWGVENDAGKSPWDWFWLIGYLAQKAATAALTGDIEKAKHHCVSTAATMLNWFRRLTGDDKSFRHGISEPNKITD